MALKPNRIERYVKNVSFNGSIRADILSLRPYWDRLLEADTERLWYVRGKLRDLGQWLPKPKKKWVYMAIHILNAEINARRGIDGYHPTGKKHPVTDHALCRALERFYKIDLDALKSRVWQDAVANDWLCVKEKGKIVTFLKPRLPITTMNNCT